MAKYKKGMIISIGDNNYIILVENLGQGYFTVYNTGRLSYHYYSNHSGGKIQPNGAADLHINTLKTFGPIQTPTTKQALGILKYLT